MILTIKTDNPEAEIGLYEAGDKIAYVTWHAHRQLAETIHRHIDDILTSQSKSLEDITGIVCFQGPGSFTGLRIGLSVANALATSLGASIVATRDEGWIETGLARLASGENDIQALPFYGADAHITPQKK